MPTPKYKFVKAWRKKFPYKYRAHKKIFSALRNGTLHKEDCWCGKTKVQAHHADYRRPLKVIWLCKEHHTIADILRKKRGLK